MNGETMIGVMAQLLEEIAKRVIVQHREGPMAWPHRGEYWEWGECRVCLCTWRGMIPEHVDDCPMQDIEVQP